MGKQDINEREFTVVGELNEECSALLIHNFKPLSRMIRPLKEKTLEISFKVLRLQRSAAQNRYIWGVVVPTVRAWMKETNGEAPEKDAVYVWMRKSLLGHSVEVKEILGEEIIIMTGRRFSQMNTKEFGEAIDTIVQKMAEMGCIVPLPRENNFLSDFLRDT